MVGTQCSKKATSERQDRSSVPRTFGRQLLRRMDLAGVCHRFRRDAAEAMPPSARKVQLLQSFKSLSSSCRRTISTPSIRVAVGEAKASLDVRPSKLVLATTALLDARDSPDVQLLPAAADLGTVPDVVVCDDAVKVDNGTDEERAQCRERIQAPEPHVRLMVPDAQDDPDKPRGNAAAPAHCGDAEPGQLGCLHKDPDAPDRRDQQENVLPDPEVDQPTARFGAISPCPLPQNETGVERHAREQSRRDERIRAAMGIFLIRQMIRQRRIPK